MRKKSRSAIDAHVREAAAAQIRFRLEAQKAQARLSKEQTQLAHELWGQTGTKEQLRDEFARLRDLTRTLEMQRDNALKELNDYENLETYIQRFNGALTIIHEVADACLTIGKQLRIRLSAVKPLEKK